MKIYYWKCLNCNKEYNSKNILNKPTGRSILGMRVTEGACPYCKTGHSERKCKFLRVEEVKNK